METCSKLCINMLFFLKLYIFLHFVQTSLCIPHPAYEPLENIAIDCGSSELQTTYLDGRNWSGDVISKYVGFDSQRNSTVSTASSLHSDPAAVPDVPYKTARLFYSNFTYTFNVTPGPKFVRLHFYPYHYSGLDPSKAFISVIDGDHHTLLSNFSASLAANYKNFAYFFKEFIIQAENHWLNLTFTPSGSFAFVNGIELVSMPLNLYIKGEDTPLDFVGYPEQVIRLDNTSALETVYRINVGGFEVSPKLDSGLFRTWTRDDQYIFGAAIGGEAFDYDLTVRYTSTVPPYTAPDIVYRTGRFMGTNAAVNLNYNLSWYFPIETGFLYLVRLHFCELARMITKRNQRVFSIYINNQTAKNQADVISWAEGEADVIGWSNGQGVPVYKDYVTMIPQVREKIQDLWLELHPDTGTSPQYYDAILNGVEIFKLSNNGGNLAGPNPPQPQGLPVTPSPRTSKKRRVIIVGCLIGGVALAFLISFVIAFQIRAAKMATDTNKTRHRQSVCHCFTIKEIKAATNNLDKARTIGTGGFGIVYKGYTEGGANTVAIKHWNQASFEQGFSEFEAEIRTLSLLRHRNVVSLIGYCNDEQEMILVYEYMANGSLFDHLHFFNKLKQSALSWEQRLQICIGAAHGLCYLHTGLEHPIVHRDVKTSNILLNDKWVAKISDFGLCKIGPTNGSTKVKGSIGYLDPEYCRLHKLTEKSDVYSFGVVLLEVLSARFVVNPDAEEEHNQNEEDEDTASFVEWGLDRYENAAWDQLIDPHLEGKITSSSLAKYMEITKKCLAERGIDRPSMTEVLWSLELVQQLQMNEHGEDRNISLVSVGNSDMFPGVEFSELMMPVGR